jgi:hypothetical protein
VAAATCVRCLTNPDCAGTATPVCTTKHQCVECVSNTDCKVDGGAPLCDTDRGRCAACIRDTDCPSTGGQKGKCDNGVCRLN